MILNSGRVIENNTKPYIVAELNSSHYGKVELAKEMIKKAKECGCDAVKFQSWSAESLYSSNYFEKDPISKRMVSRFSLRSEELFELSEYCRKLDIGFSSTPYSRDEVDFLVEECKADYIKIASMDINNLPFIGYIAKKRMPIVLSTGMASVKEIEDAVECIEKEGNKDICILHCVSIYPANAKDINLNNMQMLRKRFPDYAIGYSDHTTGYEIACAAVALGASLIEKHFTLDNKKVGWDNQMATEPLEMAKLVEKCHNTFLSMGLYERVVSDLELEQRNKMRRSIIAGRDLPSGHVITRQDISAKRPGTGIPVNRYKDVIGKQTCKNIKSDHMILWEDLVEADNYD